MSALPLPVRLESTYNTVVYKACRSNFVTGRLVSACLRDPRLMITYAEGEWTNPILPGTPLMAFVSLRAAHLFAWGTLFQDTYEIWRAEGVVDWDWNMQRRGLMHPSDLPTANIQRFWNDSTMDVADQWLYLPAGTVLCRSLKLLEKLQ